MSIYTIISNRFVIAVFVVHYFIKTILFGVKRVHRNFEFFAQEKWRIASDKSGSGNTANIGSITYIADILQGKGVFFNLGEEWFNEYWQNYGKITFKEKKITDLKSYLQFKGKTDIWMSENLMLKRTIGNTKNDE